MRIVFIIFILLTFASSVFAVEDATQVSLIVNNPPNPEIVQNIGPAGLLDTVLNILSSGLAKTLLAILAILGLGAFFFLRRFKITKKIKVDFLSKISQNKGN